MLMRDEADLVAQSLDHQLTWADTIFILDMGSVDGTWDIIQDYAKRDSRVVPFASKSIIFSDTLRGFLFEHHRDRFEPGDWVLRADTDEFYHVTPPRFVAERMRPSETAAHLQWYYFRLTRQEVEDYDSGRVNVIQDRRRPIEERRRFYKQSTYAEPRMFQFRKSIRWPQTASFPYNAGFVARNRIPIRHYPHRDPAQMERRFRLRAAMMKLNAHAGSHWKLEHWRKELVDAVGASQAAQGHAKVGLSGESGIDTGPLLYWEPGTALKEVPQFNHIPPLHVRLAQRLAHSALLSVLDRFRPRHDPLYQPTPLPTEIAGNIYEGLD